jgi:dicarboxylate/amino acid:cation (Na+ or H+) symporter, DAACS family
VTLNPVHFYDGKQLGLGDNMSRPVKILLGLVLGASAGITCYFIAPGAPWLETFITNVTHPVGQVFLRLILMTVVPLVFSALVVGVYELGDLRSIGRVGTKTFIYTIVASVSSVVVGLVLVSWIKPGKNLDPAFLSRIDQMKATAATATVLQNAAKTQTLPEILVSLIPKNPLVAATNALEGDMVALMIFALIFGTALGFVHAPGTKSSLVDILTSLRDVSMKIVDFAMGLAPIGVAALIFTMTARFGWSLLVNLLMYVLVVLAGLLFQQFVVYGAILKFYAKYSPLLFVKKIREVILTAFSTASSNATLPTTIRVAEKELGVEPKLASFVLTVGSTANQNGTALFEGVTILFLAQVFNVDLTLTQQLTVLFMSVIAGIGTAGVPGGSIPLIVIVLQSVGIPPEGIGIIMGVDRFLDMCRTVLNVNGDLVAAFVIDRSEKRDLAKEKKPRLLVEARG